jgi:hypothetical protein
LRGFVNRLNVLQSAVSKKSAALSAASVGKTLASWGKLIATAIVR